MFHLLDIVMERELLANLHRDDDSGYMKADREYFNSFPDKEFYIRKRFTGEMMPGNPPNVIVINIGSGLRHRIPYLKDPVTEQDVADVASEFKYNKDLVALESMSRSRGRSRKSKARKAKKGFGTVK